MKKLLLLSILIFTSSCQQVCWQPYKQAALKEGLVPLPPDELFPDNPERGYLHDKTPFLAGKIIEEEIRTKHQRLLQQASKVRLVQIRQVGNNCWSEETTKTELPAVPVNDDFRQLVQRWATAPNWMQLVPCNVSFSGIFVSQDAFYFLDDQGKETGCIRILQELNQVCKPQGQKHYDDMRLELYKALNIPH